MSVQISTEEVKEVPFCDRMNVEGELEIERVEKLRGFAEKSLKRLRMQKDDGTVEVQGV